MTRPPKTRPAPLPDPFKFTPERRQRNLDELPLRRPDGAEEREAEAAGLALWIPLAQRGHKDIARRVAGRIAALIERGDELPPVARAYLLDGLRAIATGTPGSAAFHTAGKKGVKDFGDQAAAQYRNQVLPALHVERLRDEGAATTTHAASVAVEEQFPRDGSTIRKHHRKLFKPQ